MGALLGLMLGDKLVVATKLGSMLRVGTPVAVLSVGAELGSALREAE